MLGILRIKVVDGMIMSNLNFFNLITLNPHLKNL